MRFCSKSMPAPERTKWLWCPGVPPSGKRLSKCNLRVSKSIIKTLPTASHQIILLSGRPVGRLYVAQLEQEIRIVDITLLPPERNAGIGSSLLSGLLDEAERVGKVIRIYVEDFNPSLRLFERLNFKALEQHGIHLLLEWSPNAG